MKHMRVVGLDEKITEAMVKGIGKIKELDLSMIMTKVQVSVYPFYTADEMCKGGVRQVFLGKS